jgi:hypothetical protein
VNGVVCVSDLMPVGTTHRAIIRQVTSEGGEIPMVLELALQFDYGNVPPWLRAQPRTVRGVVGPDLVVFRSPIDARARAKYAGHRLPPEPRAVASRPPPADLPGRFQRGPQLCPIVRLGGARCERVAAAVRRVPADR